MAELSSVRAVEAGIALPPNGIDHVGGLLDEMHAALQQVLALSKVEHDDINARSAGVFVVGWNQWQWSALPDEAAPHVGRARDALRRLREFSANAARLAPDRYEELEGLESTFEQPGGSHPNGAPKPSIEQVRDYAKAQLGAYRGVIGRLPSAHGLHERLLIPDTSALLDRPDLQNWKLAGIRGRSSSCRRCTRNLTTASATLALASRAEGH